MAISRADGLGVLQLEDRSIPSPASGELLIRVAAAGVNRPDILQRLGFYPPPPGASDILGLEVAGTVWLVGCDVDPGMIGKSVCALVAGGGYAEYCAAPTGNCLPVPASLSMVEAAALPETLFTVWHNLFERAFVKQGDTVLVHGGTSGIGSMAILLCRVFGIGIAVTCGTSEKCAAALAIGADIAIDYKTEDFVARVKEWTQGRGVDAVLDMVGGDYVPLNLSCLAEDGRHVSIAFQRGATAQIDIADMMRRRLILTGSTLRARSNGFKALLAGEIEQNIWPEVMNGHLRPVMDRVFPLAKASAAHEHMESGKHIGKIVLTMP